MPRSEPARHARAGRRPRPQAAPPAAVTASTRAVVLGGETTAVVVLPGGWHLNSVQIRDLPYFIGSTTVAAPGPHIPPGTYFLADGARTWSSAASPMCSYLRDSRGGRRRRLCCRAHPSSAANLNPPSGRRCRR